MIYKDKKYIIGETKYSKLTDIELKKQCESNLEDLQGIYTLYQTDNTSRKLLNSYDRDFKVHTVLLREQLLLRLPRDIISEKDKFYAYEHPINPLGFKALISDFQMLVLSFDPN